MNDEQLEFEMGIAPKDTQREFAGALIRYIMLGLSHAKERGKKEMDIEATLPMLDMVKRAIEGELRIIEVQTATDLMNEALNAGVYQRRTEIRV